MSQADQKTMTTRDQAMIMAVSRQRDSLAHQLAQAEAHNIMLVAELEIARAHIDEQQKAISAFVAKSRPVAKELVNEVEAAPERALESPRVRKKDAPIEDVEFV